MKTIENHDVKIFTDNIEDAAMDQIRKLLSIDVFSGCRIRVMPDVHAGAGCVIGFTGDLGDKVIPNIVGVDIGCGILVQPFRAKKELKFHWLNEFITGNIPVGRNVRDKNFAQLKHQYMEDYSRSKSLVKELVCYRELKDSKRVISGIGSLGGGNHFIEVDTDADGMSYLVVHTGSRNLGKQVADIYQKLALKNMSGWDKLLEEQNRMIAEYKAAGRKAELQDAIRELHNSFRMQKPSIPQDLCYLESVHRDNYLHDMRLCQEWAVINRRMIAAMIMEHLRSYDAVGEAGEAFESVHNYISEDNLIRKGAISAEKGQKCIIPLNMRDGSLICTGKGNPDWNCSAPHGAGRIMSRGEAFRRLSMEDFRTSMSGIYSETVTESTIDESPMVYKPKEEIMANITDTVDVVNVIRPVFNFKAAE